jgi:Fur family ferric uptake transcriptional regulator
MKKASDLEKIIKDSNLKSTKNRVEVLSFLKKEHKPLTAEEISKKLKINIVTIYRVLEKLVSKGIIYQTDFRKGKSFFEFQDKDHHHHHIVCSECNHREAVNYCLDKKDFKNIISNSGFQKMNGHILEFFGVCKKCDK